MTLTRLALAFAIATLSQVAIPLPRVSALPEWEQSSLVEQVYDVAIDPVDSRIVYATGASGFWKSTDGGGRWSLQSPEKISLALAIDPKNPSTIYAGGNQQRGGGGIYRSTDGGKNWSIVRTGESPRSIVADSTNASIVYAGLSINNNYEILKSTDGGSTWVPLLQPKFSQSPGIGWVTALALAPSRTSVIYAGLAGYHYGQLLRSDDGGRTWRDVSRGGSAPLMTPSAIAVDPQNPDLVYAGWALMGYKKLFKSTDGGGTWQDLSGSLPQGGSAVTSLLVDPSARNTLIATMPGNAGGSNDGPPGGVYASDDGGLTWRELGQAGADKICLALVSKSRTLYAGGRTGISVLRLGFQVDGRYLSYYDSHDGLRVLGGPISQAVLVDGYSSQYFEKGRIEDHSGEVADANWAFMYGLLVDELQATKANLPVGGDASSLSYAGLYDYARPSARINPPAGFEGGVAVNNDGSAFVPYHFELKAEAGHTVPKLFWDYINRADLFPGGWLHDLGLPMTEAVPATVDKGDAKGREILIQAFQRTVLTYDQANPADWQVERANVGTDYLNR